MGCCTLFIPLFLKWSQLWWRAVKRHSPLPHGKLWQLTVAVLNRIKQYGNACKYTRQALLKGDILIMNQKNNWMTAFRRWAKEQGYEYTTADGNRLMDDIRRWAQTDGKEYFKSKIVFQTDERKLQDAEFYATAIKSLILDSDPEANVIIRKSGASLSIAIDLDILLLDGLALSEFAFMIGQAASVEIGGGAPDDTRFSLVICYTTGTEIEVSPDDIVQ